MTIIKKMVMHGFKSFARRQEIVFDGHFNCILGPNGSGKSNVLDALCFVLGKASAKGLRAEKSANLIYNGGKSKKPANAGKVSIYFDNSTKEFPLDAPEISVTRIITQSGQSRYRINDIIATRQQVLDLLSIAKIDPDGYNIILQGDIIRFIEMTPMEKRQVIEEISGISIYEDKKQKAMNELAKVDSKLSEADIIMKERQTYLKELKKDRDQALKYKELNDKIKENKASFLRIQIDGKEDILKSQEERMGKQRSELEKKKERMAGLKETIKQKRAEAEEITRTVEKQGETENLKKQKEIEELRVSLATDRTRVSSCETEMLRIEQKRDQLKKNLSEVEGKMDEMKRDRSKLEKQRDQLTRDQEALGKKIEAFRKKHKIEEESAEVDKKLEEIDAKSEEMQKSIQDLREEQQNLFREKDKIEFQIKTVDEKIEKVTEVEKEHKKEIAALKEKKDEFKRATLSLNEALDRSSKLAAEIAGIEARLYKDKEELAKLRIRDAESKEKAYSSLAQKKILENRSKFGKVFGTVAELGKVPQKYSLAMEVAAGQKVKGIIVESDAVAAKCIEYLRDNKLGIASFFPLNKIRGHDIGPAVRPFAKKQGAYGFAVDLITYDPRFKDIFSFVFKDTIVVDTLDNARKIGVGTVRMVTLKGDLVESSGAMQGGFRKPVASSFQDKEFSGEMAELEGKVGEAELRIMSLMKGRKENEGIIIGLRETKAGLEGEIIKVEKSLHLQSDDLDASVAYKRSMAEKLKSVSGEEEGLTRKISAMNRDFAQLKIARQQLKAKLTEIRNPLVLAELNTFDQRKAELRDELIKAESDLRSIEIQLVDIYSRDRENTVKIISDLDKEERGFREEIVLLKSRMEGQHKDLKVKEEEQAKFYARFKSLFAKRSLLNEEISKAEDAHGKIDLESRKDEYSINTHSLEMAKVKAELSGLAEEFRQYEGVKLNLKKPIEEMKKEIKAFEKMKEDIGSVNMRALEIYEKVEQEYGILIEKQKNLEKEKNDVLRLMEQIESRKIALFKKTYAAVGENFQRIFESLSSKGKAYLELENETNPFEGGLFIKVRLTGQRYMDIRSLSGGEKTMTALAFIFAVQEYDPASFYVLDEVDAALDKHNSEKFAKLIAKYADNSQYIIISHNDMVISHANSIYGVSMDNHGITKVMSLKI